MYKKVAGGWLHAALQHCRLNFYTRLSILFVDVQLHMYVLYTTYMHCFKLN